jgi:hypothetical protein
MRLIRMGEWLGGHAGLSRSLHRPLPFLDGLLRGELADVEAALGVEDQAGVEVGQRDVVDAHGQQADIHAAKIKRLPLEEVGGVELVHRREVAHRQLPLKPPFTPPRPATRSQPAAGGDLPRVIAIFTFSVT